MPKYGVISGPYFPVFSLNTGKYGPRITPYLGTLRSAVKNVALKIGYNISLVKLNNNENRAISNKAVRVFYS